MADIAAEITAPRWVPVVVERRLAPGMCVSCDARTSSVCAAIDEEDLHRLAAVAVVMEIAAGRSFIQEGDSADNFYNVTHGVAALYKLLPDGRRQITGFAHRGDFLGLAVSQSYAFSAEALNPLRICRFSRCALRLLLDDFPALEQRLLRFASNELVAAQEQILLLGRKTARERVASFLLAQEQRQIGCEHGEHPLCLPMTRTDIADYLGLTIETVSRTFSRLKKEGLIVLPFSDQVVIQDRDGLVALAEGYGEEH